MKRILIVGATGGLGRELLKECARRDHDLHALVRSETRRDAGKMEPLRAAGVTVHEGDLNDYDSLLRAFRSVDKVISAVTFLSGDERVLLQAAKDAGVGRLVPSAFGMDFQASPPGSCIVLDRWRENYSAIQSLGVPATIIHTNGFFRNWVFTLGDMTTLEGRLPPSAVSVYGDGDVPAAFADERDIAAVTIRALEDPAMENRQIRIRQNVMSQNTLIDLWEELSGRAVERTSIDSKRLAELIEGNKRTGRERELNLFQLAAASWIRGETLLDLPNNLDSAEVYPDITYRSARLGLTAILEDGSPR
jgi:uncharacterized protein YbjT (DUF2867 family)